MFLKKHKHDELINNILGLTTFLKRRRRDGLMFLLDAKSTCALGILGKLLRINGIMRGIREVCEIHHTKLIIFYLG